MCALRKCTPFVDVISLLETPVLEIFHNSFYLTAKLAEAIRRMNYSTDKSPNTSSVRLGDRFYLTIRQSFYGKIFGKMSRPRQCASDGLLLRSPVPDPILKRGGSASHKAPAHPLWHIPVPLVRKASQVGTDGWDAGWCEKGSPAMSPAFASVSGHL